jgi:pimeloyl-ACP methyl ester carboxylesterase
MVAVVLTGLLWILGRSTTPSVLTAGPITLHRAKPHRGAVASIIPEIDQFKLATYLLAPIDPCVDPERARRIRSLFLSVYRPLRQDPDFAALPSLMPTTYRAPNAPGALVVYRPEDADESLPVVLFLHGWGGPFRGYLWVLRSLAESEGVAIVAPSFGLGSWSQPDGQQAIDEALTFIVEDPDLDADRVVLAGLSNGGLGVSRAVLAGAERFAAVVYLSPVLESRHALAVGEAMAGKPVRIVTGAEDCRVPADWVAEGAAAIASANLRTRLVVVPGEDHFLLFSQPEVVLAELAGVIRDVGESR